MSKLSEFDFSPFFYSPEELAKKVLQVFYDNSPISYPIDPFKLLKELNIVYQLRNFDKLEGIYIVPIDESDIPVVGINNNRPITRQRYTAAHEICHHLKDKVDIFCPISGTKNRVEKFADQFAASLLMPIGDLAKVSGRYLADSFISFEDVLRISVYFGVSFEACLYRLAYTLNRVEGDISQPSLKRRIRSFKPQLRKTSLGLEQHEIGLLRNIIDSYELFLPSETPIVWYRFKNDFVYNENRLEGLKIDRDEVSEIVTDLRLRKQQSEFCTSEFQAIIEVCGHSALYDYIFEAVEEISIYKLLRFHQILYQFSPHPEAAGSFRQSNNFVVESKFETSDFHNMPPQIKELDKEVQELVENLDNVTLTGFIEKAVRIHHKITVIHPFSDGNGRVSRAFLNWLFKLKKLPPVYIKYEYKQKYFDALSMADTSGNYDPLVRIFYQEILRSMFELNSKFR